MCWIQTDSISFSVDHIVLLTRLRPSPIRRALHCRSIHVFNVVAVVRSAISTRSSLDSELSESSFEIVLIGAEVAEIAAMILDFTIAPFLEILDEVTIPRTANWRDVRSRLAFALDHSLSEFTAFAP